MPNSTDLPCSPTPDLERSRTRPGPRPRPQPQAEQIARSVQGRSIDAITLGTGSRRIYVIAGIHGDEPEGQAAVADIIAHFNHDPRGTIRLVPDMNPDATHARSRTNASGVDLNRNWPARNFRPARSHGIAPLSEPEAAGVHDDLLAFLPDVVVVFHSSSRVHAPFVNYDGPASHLADAFASAAAPFAIAWSVVPNMGYPTPGSLGSYVGVDLRIPILTIEFQRGQGPASVTASTIAALDAIMDSTQNP